MQRDHDNLNELEVAYKIGKDMLGAEETTIYGSTCFYKLIRENPQPLHPKY